MKNIGTFLTIAAVALAAASCRSETETIDDCPEISITVGIPDPMDAYSKAPLTTTDAFSHLGGAMTVDPASFDLRYIVEVWSNEDTPQLLHRETKCVDDNFVATTVSFKIRIQSLPCKLVFWSDFVEQGSSDDLHYNTANNLQNISYSDQITSIGDLASDDIDAYCAVVPIESVSNDQKRHITLRRPFGKLRLLATDQVEGGDIEGVKPIVATIDFKDVPVADTYNVLTGRTSVNEKTDFSKKFDFNIIRENALVNNASYDAYLLGFDYLFVTDQAPSYALDVTVYGDEAKTFPLATKNLSGIPISANKLTTVIGVFYSSHGSVNIIVNDEFDNKETASYN